MVTVPEEEARAVACGSWVDPLERTAAAGRCRVVDGRGRLLALMRGGKPPEYLRVVAAPEAAA